MPEAAFEVVGGKGQVAVELDDEVAVFDGKRAVAVVKRLHHAAARFPKAPVRAVAGADPGITARVAVEHGGRAVG